MSEVISRVDYKCDNIAAKVIKGREIIKVIKIIGNEKTSLEPTSNQVTTVAVYQGYIKYGI